MTNDVCIPNYKDGRIFVSPVIGCVGGCKYCYLKLRNIQKVIENPVGVDKILSYITHNPQYVSGEFGTIISIGAWGDIFQNPMSTRISLSYIRELIKLGNPIQFMSKYSLEPDLIQQVAKQRLYTDQLLYSTTVTTHSYWQMIEPFTSSPEKRLETCYEFKKYGVANNVLIKPFIPGVTDKDISRIIYLFKKYEIKHCVLGKLYINDAIFKDLESVHQLGAFSTEDSQLDCHGEISITSTSIDEFSDYIQLFKDNGINAFLKSSCINANLHHTNNPSNYYTDNSKYCIHCGNCS